MKSRPSELTVWLEILFGLPLQTLSLWYYFGSSVEPYVGGGLLAIRKVSSFFVLRRGLDSVLELG